MSVCQGCGANTDTECFRWCYTHDIDDLRQQLADRDRELAEVREWARGTTDAEKYIRECGRRYRDEETLKRMALARIDRALAIGRDWCNQAAGRGLLPVIEDMCAALEGKEDDETPT